MKKLFTTTLKWNDHFTAKLQNLKNTDLVL